MQVQIPKTSKAVYISGRNALNVRDDTSGDWHFHTVWYSSEPKIAKVYGENQKFNTNHIYGDYGIIDKREILIGHGLNVTNSGPVYVANHFRAILDLIYSSAKQKKMNFVIGSSMDYLDTGEQKSQLLELALKMRPFLTPEEDEVFTTWYEKEKLSIYRGEAYCEQ